MPAVAQVSFAGVALDVPTAELLSVAAVRFPGPHLPASASRGWPGSNIASQLSSPDAMGFPPGRLGSLYWPAGASRFGVINLPVDEAMADALAGVVGDGGQYPGQSQQFIYRAGDQADGFTGFMYALPLRPLLIRPQPFNAAAVDPYYPPRVRLRSEEHT